MDLGRTPCLHPPLSAAVQRCCDARNAILAKSYGDNLPAHALDTAHPRFDMGITILAFTKKQIDYEDKLTAEWAYRYAMPDPSTRQGVKEYIACVLHGMTIGVFSKNEGKDLLAGARIALAGVKYTPSPSKQKANIDFSAENDIQPAA